MTSRLSVKHMVSMSSSNSMLKRVGCIGLAEDGAADVVLGYERDLGAVVAELQGSGDG